jgi:hypothetical protein
MTKLWRVVQPDLSLASATPKLWCRTLRGVRRVRKRKCRVVRALVLSFLQRPPVGLDRVMANRGNTMEIRFPESEEEAIPQ